MSTESNIRRTIRERLGRDGWLVVPYPNTGYGAPGFPDLIAVKAGRVVFIEVKQPGKQPSAIQKHMHEKLKSKGATVIVATSIADLP